MNMSGIDINNRAKIHWACRRGMRELDLLIMPFFENRYDSLSESEKYAFVKLLQFEDPLLFSWLMHQSHPHDQDLVDMIKLIRLQNEKYGFVA